MNLAVLVLLVSICYALALNGVKFTPDASGVELLGRFNKEFASDWPGSGARFYIKATEPQISVKVSMGSVADDTLFYVEGGWDCQTNFKSPVAVDTPYVGAGTDAKIGSTYEFHFRKITEANNWMAIGSMQITDIQIVGGELVSKSAYLEETPLKKNYCLKTQHKILSIGDSITCGYGVDGVPPCTFSAETEDVTHAYAFLVAQSLNAEVQTISWSGRGVVRNYDDPLQVSEIPMPAYYNRTLADGNIPQSTSDRNYFDPSKYAADIVTVVLGTNDYSTTPYPSDEQFISGYLNFLAQIRRDYPLAKNNIAIMCATMQIPQQCDNIQKVAKLANVTYIYLDPALNDGGYGCDGHPNQATQQNMADVIVPALKEMLGEK